MRAGNAGRTCAGSMEDYLRTSVSTDAFVEQIAASKQLQMQVFVFVKKTSFRFVAKK
jgi:hypothetical protein